jgi:hypothetical protein
MEWLTTGYVRFGSGGILVLWSIGGKPWAICRKDGTCLALLDWVFADLSDWRPAGWDVHCGLLASLSHE